jgi:hypothetical protein
LLNEDIKGAYTALITLPPHKRHLGEGVETQLGDLRDCPNKSVADSREALSPCFISSLKDPLESLEALMAVYEDKEKPYEN